jgi:hypothetical protein
MEVNYYRTNYNANDSWIEIKINDKRYVSYLNDDYVGCSCMKCGIHHNTETKQPCKLNVAINSAESINVNYYEVGKTGSKPHRVSTTIFKRINNIMYNEEFKRTLNCDYIFNTFIKFVKLTEPKINSMYEGNIFKEVV